MKTMKKLLVFLVIAALLVPANVFAASADIITSHVAFEGEASSLKASAFVRDLSASPEEAVLIIAAYEGGKLIACESASGINKILRTEAIDASGAEMVKAFVWSKVENAVISEIAEYNSTPLEDDVVIKIGGEVIDFDENGNYDYASVATAEGIVIPDIEVELKDNSMSYSVWNDLDNKKSVITVEYGTRNVTKRDAVTGYNPTTVTKEVYTKPSKVYTVNYTDTDIYSNASYAATGGDNGVTTLAAAYQKAEVDVEEGVATKVTAVIDKVGTGNFDTGILIIKPKDASKKGSSVVDAEGNVITKLTDDTTTVIAVDGYKNKTYAKKGVAGTQYYDGDSNQININVYYPTHCMGEQPYLTPIKHYETCDSTSTANSGFHDIPEELVGCEYISLYRRLGGSQYKAEFYVNTDVTVYALLRTTSKLSNVTVGEGEGAVTVTAAAEDSFGVGDFIYASIGKVSAPVLAYLIKNNYIPSEWVSYVGNEVKSDIINWKETAYEIKDYSPFVKMYHNGITGLKYTGTALDNKTDVKTYIKNWFEGSANSVIESWDDLFSKTISPSLKNVWGNYGHKYFDTNIIESGLTSTENTMLNTSWGSVGTGCEHGVILSYPEVLELKGTEFFASAGVYWSYEAAYMGKEALKLTPKTDCEIWIATFSKNGGSASDAKAKINGEEKPLIEVNLEEQDYIQTTFHSAAKSYVSKLHMIKVNAGEEFTAVSPTSGVIDVFVKPIK